jgi:hypothetical protein
MANGNNKRLKAYVRYDGSGRVVPSSVILARFKPKVGNYKEINAYECCNDTALPANCIEFVVDTTGDTFFIFNFTTIGPINFTIDWGDGTTHPDSGAGGFYEESHTYAQEGQQYTVRVCFDNISAVTAIEFLGNDY